MKWRTLILGGGGSTGEFQRGALEVVAQHYDKFDMYIGVGIGSVHSTVLAQYDTLAEGVSLIESFWSNLKKTSDVFQTPLLGEAFGLLASMASEKSWARDSIYNNNKMRNVIGDHVDWERLKNKTNWAIELTSLNDGRTYVLSNNNDLLSVSNKDGHQLTFSLDPKDPYFIGSQIVDFTTAAGSVPFMLPPVDIFNHRFVEGGLRDFTPLALGVKQFELIKDQGYTEVEFVIIDNYTQEVAFETSDLLDSGKEIMVRTVKIMTVEMARNDISKGNLDLKMLNNVKSKVIMIQPQIDYRLQPMDFNDHEKREKARNHGVTQAEIQLNHKILEQFQNKTEREPIPAELEKLFTLVKKQKQLNGISNLAKPLSHHVNFETTFAPHNLTELKEVMKTSHDRGLKLKAVGAGYAFSNIVDTEGVQIFMGKYLRNVWTPQQDLFKSKLSAMNFIEFEAGATVEDLTSKLWAEGRVLLNQPGYEKLNYLGVATAGGHGSGLHLPPIADTIVSLDILTFDKNGTLVQRRIEQTEGITDPIKFKAAFPTIELIQDDAIFNACIVSVGCLGIIYSLIVKTEESYYLQEKRYFTDWKTLKPIIYQKLEDSAIHSMHIWFNPYETDGVNHCVVSEYRKAEGPKRGKRGWGTTFKGADEMSPVLEFLMDNFPKLAPAVLNMSLKATVNHEEVVLPTYEAINFGTPNEVKVYAADCSIPYEKTAECAESLFALMEARRNDGINVTSPIGFRFTHEGKGFLSPQYGRKSCMIELPSIYGTDAALDTIDAFHNLLYQKFEGRPHWGQVNRIMNKEIFKKQCPAWREFIKVYADYNDGTFDGPFTEQLGFRELVEEIKVQKK
jgi:FAD/FMN-containing dehydrogenase